jgi:hypothetical protein
MPVTLHESHFDDLDTYIASYTDEDREELDAAELAIDLAMLFRRGLVSQDLREVSQLNGPEDEL